MQAKRKIEDPAAFAHIDWPMPAAEDSWSPRLADRPADADAPSPPHLMWDELAARLQHAAAPAGAWRHASADADERWPIPARLATMAVLSATAWAATIGLVRAIL